MCGGTQLAVLTLPRRRGLSPRVRGNPPAGASETGRRAPRAIPACAGEPVTSPPYDNRRTGYPRVCGGTGVVARLAIDDAGLSPRVRGNPVGVGVGVAFHRAIPACAGEPPAPAAYPPAVEVYPRVCGGTPPLCLRPLRGAILSPRVRGNRIRAVQLTGVADSIPACAGEPHAAHRHRYRRRVYPRVCGGTARRVPLVISWSGLSPRVRGNRSAVTAAPACIWSIPACAGEPDASSSGTPPGEVYPRVCGGT